MASEGQNLVGNMMVPIDLLPPILDDLMRFGRVDQPPRPWLGLFATDTADGVVVTGLAPGGPAARAGLAEGDAVTALAGQEIEDLGDPWRRLWAEPTGRDRGRGDLAARRPHAEGHLPDRRSPHLHEAAHVALITSCWCSIFYTSAGYVEQAGSEWVFSAISTLPAWVAEGWAMDS